MMLAAKKCPVSINASAVNQVGNIHATISHNKYSIQAPKTLHQN